MSKLLDRVSSLLGIWSPPGIDHDVYGLSHPGRMRAGNEDAFLVSPSRGLYVIADGMGGHRAGEVASRETVDAVDAYFSLERLRPLWAGHRFCQEALTEAVVAAHTKILELGASRDDLQGMGCTIVLALVYGNAVRIVHVGDTRAYLVRQTGMTLLTRDHTTVADLVEQGLMTPGEVRYSPLRNELTQAVGVGATIAPEFGSYDFGDGDRLLLCSDGLWGMLPEAHILRAIVTNRNARRACRQLVSWANAAGGEDNITVVVIGGGSHGSAR